MTLQLLDIAPIRDDYRKLQEQNYNLQQKLSQSQDQIKDLNKRIDQLENQLEEISKMTPKQRNKYFKELKKQREKEAKEKQTSQVATPFSTLKSDNNIDLSQSQQAETTVHTLSTAGMGYDQGSSSTLLSSIMIVSAAIFLCISGAMAYRRKK